jgi:hypothetical protein
MGAEKKSKKRKQLFFFNLHHTRRVLKISERDNPSRQNSWS